MMTTRECFETSCASDASSIRGHYATMLIATQLIREEDYALRGTIELTIWPRFIFLCHACCSLQTKGRDFLLRYTPI